ncbi:gliding motility-associated protein GldE [Hydrotalea sp.]|uniref:gliding motility-associated protein GldE n=1 Tax=Hydrotalea sp. TaxID=2881279 RepID=UPI00260B1D2F|nr:gliding motility-associated protein GldE [Hydrotalea sp.]
MDHHPAFYLFTLLNAAIPQGSIALIILLFVLLAVSFFVSGAEAAFFSLKQKDINLLKTKQNPSYKRIIHLLTEPKKLLASLLIANSFINIAIIIIFNIGIDEWIMNYHPAFLITNIWIEFLIKVVIVTAVLLLFGEVMPKILATQNNIRFAKEVAPLIEFIHYICKRLSNVLVKYSDIIERRLAQKTGSITSDELYHAIEITKSGTNENEKNILKGIIKFGNITVKQIMKARLEVHGVEYNTNFHALLQSVADMSYSRVPVYKEGLDEVVGILRTKDLLPFLNEPDTFEWHNLISPPYFVHEHKMIEDLLREFQSRRIHFAIVVDEFGGTSGIVTLEDILEEIIGDIKDEFDEEEYGYRKLDDYNYIFEGKIMINDVCKIMQLPVDTFDTLKGESDSLAGLVLEIAGDIPKKGQIVSIPGFDFIMLEVEKTRINKIKVTISKVAND